MNVRYNISKNKKIIVFFGNELTICEQNISKYYLTNYVK